MYRVVIFYFSHPENGFIDPITLKCSFNPKFISRRCYQPESRQRRPSRNFQLKRSFDFRTIRPSR